MKYAILLAAGMADEPIEALAGKTPAEAAHTPALDHLTRNGKAGAVRTIPDDLPASEEVALLSALGYDPAEYFTGEAALAAGDADLDIGTDRIALIYNLVTEADHALVDHAAGWIMPKEAGALLKTLSGALAHPDVLFRAGRGFSGLIVIPAAEEGLPECKPPEAVLGSPIEKGLPKGPNSDFLRHIIQRSREVFGEHEINRVRADLGENPSSLLWPWGPGRPMDLPSFESAHGLRAAMVAGLESARGLGRLAGMTVPTVPGATGTYRTDCSAKAQRALELLSTHDLVVIHVASPAEAAIEGNVHRKIAAIEDIDAMLVAPLLKRARQTVDMRILFVATHLAGVQGRRRTRDPVPAAMFGKGFEPIRRAAFSESAARSGEFNVEQGHELLPYFLRT